MSRLRTVSTLLLAVTVGAAATAQFDSSTLPVLVFDLAPDAIPNDPKVDGRFRVIDNGPGEVNRPTDPGTDYDGPAGFERRGQTSQAFFPKLGYGVELRDASGEDSSATLLGMPAESDWVLHGPYSDKSLIRNAFAYSLAGEIMTYAPRARFVELVLGGDYVGVYLLTERVSRDRERVSVDKLDADDLAGDSLTGGYILKFDKVSFVDGPEPKFELAPHGLGRGTPRSAIAYHYPKADRIAPEQRAYITEWMQDFEDVLASPNAEDTATGYRTLMSVKSFVDFLLVNEVTLNIDAYRISTYFSKEADSDGGQLRMGPVWDYNVAMGNADYCNAENPVDWIYDFDLNCPEDFFQGPMWFPRLMALPTFRADVEARYRELRAGGVFSDDAVSRRIDSLVGIIAGAPVTRNFERWPSFEELVWPNPVLWDSHEAAVEYVRDFVLRRLAWMDERLGTEPLSDLRDVTHAATLKLSPNPGRGVVRLHGASPSEYPAEVRFYSGTGQLLTRQPLDGAGEVALPTQPGAYVVEFWRSGRPVARSQQIVTP